MKKKTRPKKLEMHSFKCTPTEWRAIKIRANRTTKGNVSALVRHLTLKKTVSASFKRV